MLYIYLLNDNNMFSFMIEHELIFWLEYFKYESQRGRLWEKQGKKLSKPRDKWNKIAYENEIWTAPSAELFCFSFLCQSERKNGKVMMASFASFTPLVRGAPEVPVLWDIVLP